MAFPIQLVFTPKKCFQILLVLLAAATPYLSNATADTFPDVNNGIVLEFGLDEGTGSVAHDAATADGVHNGTVNNAQWTDSGRVNGALTFNGTSAEVRVAGPAPSIDNLSSMSLSFWSNASGWGELNSGCLIAKSDNSSGGHGWTFAVAGSDGKVSFNANFSGASDLVVTSLPTALELGRWIHWVVAWDGSTDANNVHIYKDGLEVLGYTTRQSGVGSRSADAADDLRISNCSKSSSHFSGTLDELRIYNRMLSADEARALYAHVAGKNPPSPITLQDLRIDGEFGSSGTSIQQTGRNAFKLVLGAAPGHPTWPNLAQFVITHNATGNDLLLDAEFTPTGGSTSYPFKSSFYSWSYDKLSWDVVNWGGPDSDHGRLIFTPFTQDTVYFGNQIGFSNEMLEARIQAWAANPAVQVITVGQSLGGKNIYRIVITDPDSPYPLSKRWATYVGHQHAGEANASWRIIRMIDWLLSAEGADMRRRFVMHFVPLMNPDGPAHGYYRVTSEGLDMNRTYSSVGANSDQGHEAYLLQNDIESIMLSAEPLVSVWSMHTWSGLADPAMNPGPEIDDTVGSAQDFADVLTRNDPQQLFKPLNILARFAAAGKYRVFVPKTVTPTGVVAETGTAWSSGPGNQFAISAFLVEGGSGFTLQENMDAGVAVMKTLAEFYRGLNLIRASQDILQIGTKALPDAAAGASYSASLASSGGSAPYQWSVAWGALPQGLSLNAQTGQVSGTASSTQTSFFTVKLSDAGARVTYANLSLTVSATLRPMAPAGLRVQ